MRQRVLGLALTVFGFLMGGGVMAGQPQPWEMTLQPPSSPIMERLVSLNNLLLAIITVICAMVLVLLLFACIRFRESARATASKRTHNTLLEVVWTAVPVLILVIIAVPSFKLLYFADVVPETDMTVKVTGHQWYWTYEYPDNGNFAFDALMVPEEELQPGQPRLLATDNHVVVPVDTNIRIQVTADDVLHSWAVPSLGVKRDAVPGRLNEIWIRVDEAGMYYGQCSELCGTNHGFMPIAVEAVSKEEFQAWVEQAQQEFARSDSEPVTVASKAPAAAAQ